MTEQFDSEPQEPTLGERADDLNKRVEAYLTYSLGPATADEVGDLREGLQSVVSDGRQGAARLLQEMESLDREIAEEQRVKDEQRQKEQHASALDAKVAEVRAERQKTAAEEVQKAREDSLYQEALRRVEAEDGGDGGEAALVTEFDRLRAQYNELDPSSDQADLLRDELDKIADKIATGATDGKIPVSPADFEKEVSEWLA